MKKRLRRERHLVHDNMLSFKMCDDILAQLDAFADAAEISRSEAIRVLVTKGLSTIEAERLRASAPGYKVPRMTRSSERIALAEEIIEILRASPRLLEGARKVREAR